MYALKEVSWPWFLYVGMLLVITLFLYLPLLTPRIKKMMAIAVITCNLGGVALLLGTELGQQLPLFNTFVETNTVDMEARSGLEVYIKYGCPNCHLLNGWGPAKPLGPDLAVAFAQHDPTWVSFYLKDPTFRGNLTESIMPHYTFLKEAELNTLITFLGSAAQSIRPSEQNNSGRVKTDGTHQDINR